MIVIIKAKTEKGAKAIEALNKEKSWGLARKKITNTTPLTIEIEPKQLRRVAGVLVSQPAVKNVIDQSVQDMMQKYGAKRDDYGVSVR